MSQLNGTTDALSSNTVHNKDLFLHENTFGLMSHPSCRTLKHTVVSWLVLISLNRLRTTGCGLQLKAILDFHFLLNQFISINYKCLAS